MLIKFRGLMQGIFGKLIMAMIILTLSLFGFGAFTAFTSNNDVVVAVVNGDKIYEQELRNHNERRRQTLLQQEPDDIQAVLEATQSEAFTEQSLRDLIDRVLLEQAAERFEIRTPDEVIDDRIRLSDNFQIEGSYDASLFVEVLESVGMSIPSYRMNVEDLLRRRQFSLGLESTDFLLEGEFERALNLLGEGRDITWLAVEWSAYTDGIEINEDDIESYFTNHQEDYAMPELASMEYIELRELSLKEDISISDEELQVLYEARKDSFIPVEERTASHILINIDEQKTKQQAIEEIKALKDRIDAGEDFAELAKTYSDDKGTSERGGDLGAAEPGRFVRPFEEALWALEVGEYSEPVPSEFGVHLIRLDDVRNSVVQEFDSMKANLEDELKNAKAAERFIELRQNMAQLSYESSDLEPVAEALALPINTTQLISRAGLDEDASDIFSVTEVLVTAFSADVLEQGYNSEVLEPHSGVAVVLRVKERHEARAPELDEVKNQIKARLRREQAFERTRIIAEAALQRLIDGDDKELVAADLDTEWDSKADALRNDSSIDEAIVKAAFKLNEPIDEMGSYTSVETEPGIMLVTVTGVTLDNAKAVPESRQDSERRSLARLNGFGSLRLVREGILEESTVDKR